MNNTKIFLRPFFVFIDIVSGTFTSNRRMPGDDP
jgi:hypothetical protein